MTALEYVDDMPQFNRNQLLHLDEHLKHPGVAFGIDSWTVMGMRAHGLIEPTWPLALTAFGAEVVAILDAILEKEAGR
jgi:hypothetical protein